MLLIKILVSGGYFIKNKVFNIDIPAPQVDESIVIIPTRFFLPNEMAMFWAEDNNKKYPKWFNTP